MSTKMKVALGVVVAIAVVAAGWPVLVDYLIPVSPYW